MTIPVQKEGIMEEIEITVSLIIPVYNVEKYLVQCLESAASQDYTSYEIVIVDDGSTDNSYKICRHYCENDSRIKLVHQENQGLAAAWQRGLQESSGEYIAFLDSDDWVDSRYLSEMVARGQEGADLVCCNKMLEYGDWRIFLKERIPAGFYHGHGILEGIYPKLLNDGTYLGRGITPHRCGKLMKKSLLEQNLKYCDKSVQYGEDLNILFPVVLDCQKICILEDPDGLYHYRQNPSSILRGYKENMFQQIITLHRRLSTAAAEKQKFNFTSQLKQDCLCMFLEYIKNETKSKRAAFQISKTVVKHFCDLEKIVGEYTDIHIQMKRSDRVIVRLLCKKNIFGIFCWLQTYKLSKKLTKGVDSGLLWKRR